MADFDLTTDEQTAVDTIPKFNGRPYEPDATSPRYNPFGFDKGGYLLHQMGQAVMTMTVGLLARRMAILARADVALTHADVKLTAEDAKNTALDRVAAALSVTAAAGKVTDAAKEVQKAADEVQKAKDQVGYAKDEVQNAKTEVQNAKAEVERAKGYAAGLNMPGISPAEAGYFLKVNAAGTAYELGPVTIASAAEIVASTGKGLANAETLGPVLNEIRAVVGDVVDSLNNLAARSSGWLEGSNQVLSRTTYPQLFALIGTRYNDFGAIASGQISSGFYGNWGSGLASVSFQSNGTIYLLTDAVTQNVSDVSRIWRSTDDGLTFTELTTTRHQFTAPADVFFFKGGYVAPPRYTYDTQNGVMMVSQISADSTTWTKHSDSITSANYTMSYAMSGSYLVGQLTGTSQLIWKTSYDGSWNSVSLQTQSHNGNLSSVICVNDVFYFTANNGNIYRATDPTATGNWRLWFTHPRANEVNAARLFYVLGSFYLVAQLPNSNYSAAVHRIDASTGAATLLLTTPGGSPANPDIPGYVYSVQTDGKGRIILMNGADMWVMQTDGVTTKLGFRFVDYPTHLSLFMRPSDGLALAIPPNTKTTVKRARPAIADTDFQMPVIASPTAGMRRFIRGKP